MSVTPGRLPGRKIAKRRYFARKNRSAQSCGRSDNRSGRFESRLREGRTSKGENTRRFDRVCDMDTSLVGRLGVVEERHTWICSDDLTFLSSGPFFNTLISCSGIGPVGRGCLKLIRESELTPSLSLPCYCHPPFAPRTTAARTNFGKKTCPTQHHSRWNPQGVRRAAKLGSGRRQGRRYR